jgi:hypothetical protein
MTEHNGKAEGKTQKLPKQGRHEYLVASGHKLVIDHGVVSLVDADNQVIVSVDNGKVFVRRDKVTAVVESDVVDEEDVVTPIGEEWEDAIFHQHHVYEKLIDQAKNAKPSSNWRAELDAL